MAKTIAPTNMHDTEAADELLLGLQGWTLSNRNYWKLDWQMILKERNLTLLSSYKSAKHQAVPLSLSVGGEALSD